MLGCNSVDLASKIAGSGGKNRYVINMGAADGKSFSDPCYPLFRAGYPGVAIDRIDSPILRENLPQDNVTILTETVLRPQNVASILKKVGCPKRPLMLKVDVDGIDGDLLISTLNARFLPDFFHIEIQPEFPPGIHFSVKYHRLFEAKNGWGGFYGLSITAAEKIARAYGYARSSGT